MIEHMSGPDDPRRVYAVGDVHGRLDLLDRMIGMINRDLAERGAAGCLVVTLGDHVDRGPESRGVIERLSSGPFDAPYRGLRGNHEDLLLSFLRSPRDADVWRRNGGLETLHSYGVPTRDLMRGRGFDEAAAAFADALPEAHRRFLADLAPAVMTDRLFLCHAGVRPGVALDNQDPHDLAWIRQEFLVSDRDFGRLVVHGHTPVPEPEIRHNRINVDTGAFATGRLTCAVIEGGEFRLLNT
jgi:serine/threonine protein phosphatase 1